MHLKETKRLTHTITFGGGFNTVHLESAESKLATTSFIILSKNLWSQFFSTSIGIMAIPCAAYSEVFNHLVSYANFELLHMEI